MSCSLRKKAGDCFLGKSLIMLYKSTIITHLVIATARGIAQAMGWTRLVEYGGSATVTTYWAKSLLKRMNFTKWRTFTKHSHPADELEKEKEAFLSEILNRVSLNDIPPELIFNWDQTGINLVPTALWTLDKEGKMRIEIAGYQDKRQITGVMCSSLVGELLPFQLVYTGKTGRCHPAYAFPKGLADSSYS